MENPFVYGEVVSGEQFSNRKKEIQEFLRDMQSGERIFLISPRRYGKTSLIMNVLEEIRKKGYLTAYIDLYKAPSLKDLLIQYSKAIASSETTLERMVKLVKELLPGLRPKIEVGTDGTPGLSIDYTARDTDMGRMLEEIYDAPENIARKRGKRFVVVFDEFQEIQNLNGDRLEKAMRASFQHHKRVSYIFAGSKRHLLIDMVTNRNRAFYRMGKIMNLQKLPRSDFYNFLLKKFQDSGFIIENVAMDKILNITDEYPYNGQFLCHELWDMNRDTKRITLEGIENALESILSRESNVYIALWDTLSLHQRRLLKAIAAGGGSNIFSREFIQYYSLGALSSVQTSARLLMKKEIMDKEGSVYYISDVFFKEWIGRRMR